MPKHLRGSPDIGLVLGGREGIAQEAFADASYAVHDNAKGHSGAIVRLDNASLYARSTKKKLMSNFFLRLS